MFASDLFKQINLEAEISFIKIASYQGMRSTGQVVTSIGMEQDLHGRDLIIIEDIVDTGKTLHHFLPSLQQQQPTSIRIATFCISQRLLYSKFHWTILDLVFPISL